MKIIELTKSEFISKVGDFESDPKNWHYTGSIPCIVDFQAPWCSYCKRLTPLLEEMAEEFDGRLLIYKVDVDKEEALESAFNIRTIPNLLLCPVGRNWEQTLGVLTKQELKMLIESKLLL